MRKNEILEFIENSAEKEKAIEDLTKQKIAEFMKYQEDVFKSIQDLIKDFFPVGVKDMLTQYIDDTHSILSINNLLWIDVPNNYVRVCLNPNRFFDVYEFEGGRSYLPYNPKNITELKTQYNLLQQYVLLKNELENSIEQVYDVLVKWKEEKLNHELDFLNSLPFSTPKQKQERYKVTVIIEKITTEEMNANEKVLKVVDEALRKYGSDMISVDENEGMLDVYIVTSENSTPYMCAIAPFRMANITELERELNKRNVSHCW